MITRPENFETLPANLARAKAAGVPGIDILHGHLKSLLAEAESGEEISPRDEYARGVADTLCELYRLTYVLSEGWGA